MRALPYYLPPPPEPEVTHTSIGEASANREMQVEGANQQAQSAAGQKAAEQNQRVEVAKLERELGILRGGG